MGQECCGCSFTVNFFYEDEWNRAMPMSKFCPSSKSRVLPGDCESFSHDFQRLEHLSEEEATALLHKALGFTWFHRLHTFLGQTAWVSH